MNTRDGIVDFLQGLTDPTLITATMAHTIAAMLRRAPCDDIDSEHARVIQLSNTAARAYVVQAAASLNRALTHAAHRGLPYDVEVSDLSTLDAPGLRRVEVRELDQDELPEESPDLLRERGDALVHALHTLKPRPMASGDGPCWCDSPSGSGRHEAACRLARAAITGWVRR